MTLRVVLRSFAAQPVRSAVLASGFGAGIACMAGLLGVGQVILEQSRSPHLRGGGDVVVYGTAGDVTSARFVTSQLFTSPPLDGRVALAAPSHAATVYLVQPGREPHAVRARGGVPSLERALGDPETSPVDAWRDGPRDRAWAAPAPGRVLRAMDRFHPVPDVPARAGSWAEWLYFNGHTEDTRFYLTFLVGPHGSAGRRRAGVRLQLERDGRMTSFVDGGEIDAPALLRDAPDIRIGGSSVRLDGTRYRITLALYEQGRERSEGPPDVVGEITLDATAGASLPPFEVSGAGGWVSGYVVPVLSGRLDGRLEVRGREIPLGGGSGYHDHNWGFWEGVTWQWGQVAGDDVSLLYGRIRPPADAADPDRVPAFLIALGKRGPLGFTTDVTIEESHDPSTGRLREIVVRASGDHVELEMRLAVGEVTTHRLGMFGDAVDRGEFLQMRAAYRVAGSVAGRPVEFEAVGAAETFRMRSR